MRHPPVCSVVPSRARAATFSKPVQAIAALAAALAAVPRPVAAQDAAVYGPQAGPAPEASRPQVPAALPAALVAAVDQAISDNPQVLARRAALAVNEADLDAAKWLRYPSLTAEALAATRGSNAADADGLALNVALEQPLWAGGTIDGQIDAARSSRDAGVNGLREVRQAIMLGVIGAYFDVLAAMARIGALQAGLADHRDLVASIERRVAREVSPLADLTLARSRTTQLEIELSAAEEAAARSRLRLRELVGFDPETPAFPDPAIFDAVPPEPVAVQDMLDCTPTLERLRNEIAATEAEVRTAKGALYPRLLLQLSQNELTGARAAVVVRAQTGNGLSRFSAIDRAEARVSEAIARLGGGDREIRAQLGNEFVALRSNVMQASSGAIASTAAADLQASYQRQFVAGRRSWFDVLNAAREVTSARITEGAARVNAAASATRILALTCRWAPSGLSNGW